MNSPNTSKDITKVEALVMPLYNLSLKLQGLGHLLESDGSDMDANSDNDTDIRRGIGLLLKDLANEVHEHGRTIDEWIVNGKGHNQ